MLKPASEARAVDFQTARPLQNRRRVQLACSSDYAQRRPDVEGGACFRLWNPERSAVRKIRNSALRLRHAHAVGQYGCALTAIALPTSASEFCVKAVYI